MAKIKNFALLGTAGYVAPRHLQAIRDTGHRLLAACDPSDSVGVLDRYFLDAKYFSEVERFDRFLEKQRRMGDEQQIHYLSVCTPNYLHDAHIRLALRVGADAICEKPLVINPWNLDQLEEIEEESGRTVYTVLQLRLLPAIVALKKRLDAEPVGGTRPQIELTYIARRGPWYKISWKGDESKSGGLALNIGVHFFDLLLWLFGEAERTELHVRDSDRWSGFLALKNADVRWYLSTRPQDLPAESHAAGHPAYRSLTIDGDEIDLSAGFSDLHTRVYEDILAGGGFGIASARPSVELVYKLRHADVCSSRDRAHAMFAPTEQ